MDATAPRKKSVVAVLFGTTAVVLATLGALVSLSIAIAWNNEAEDLSLGDVGAYGIWVPAATALSLIVFSLHVSAGVMALRQTAAVAKWFTVYALVALSLGLADSFISLMTAPDDIAVEMKDNAFARMSVNVLAAPWELLCLVLTRFERFRSTLSGDAQLSAMDAAAGNDLPVDDFAALKLHPTMKAAGVCSLAAGIVCLLLALQTLGLVRTNATTVTSLLLMGLAGAVCAALGVMQLRMRGSASAWAIPVCSLTGLLAVAWMVFSIMHGLFSFMALVLIPLSLAAAWLARQGRPHGRRADEARRTLEDQGLSAGV